MDRVIKFGLLFGLVAMVLSFVVGALAGCCNCIVALGVGFVCGAIVAQSIAASGAVSVADGVEVVLPAEAKSANPVMEGAKAAALASVFMVIGRSVGAVLGAAFSHEQMQVVMTEWGADFADPAQQAIYWMGSLIGVACCGAMDMVFMVAGGALGAWFASRNR